MLYHASHREGLKELVPAVSTHGIIWVYAINNRLTALLFGVPKDDFDIIMDEEDGKPVIYEVYKDAVRKLYEGKSCSLYTVSAEGFLKNQTGWEPKLVSENIVPVIREEKINNLYEEIRKAMEENQCIIYEYSEDEVYQWFLREEISERINSFGISEEIMRTDSRFTLYINKLLGR